MTYDMAQTKLKGFPVQYGKDVVQHLNQVNSPRIFNNIQMKEIGEAVSPDVKHTSNGINSAISLKTGDKYVWFGKLEYKLKGAKVAVLFPWAQDWDHPETQMDRSINVYSDKKLPNKVVGNLLEQIAYQLALTIKPKPFNPIKQMQFSKEVMVFH